MFGNKTKIGLYKLRAHLVAKVESKQKKIRFRNELM